MKVEKMNREKLKAELENRQIEFAENASTTQLKELLKKDEKAKDENTGNPSADEQKNKSAGEQSNPEKAGTEKPQKIEFVSKVSRNALVDRRDYDESIFKTELVKIKIRPLKRITKVIEMVPDANGNLVTKFTIEF